MRDMYYSSRPLERSNMDLTEATFKAMKADTQLLFASDWPHWDFDLPSSITTLPFLDEQAKRNILGHNQPGCSISKCRSTSWPRPSRRQCASR